MGVGIRKSIVIPIRICYRSACNHPFLAGMVLFLIFLYRSFPFVFSLLVSASPVLVCTAILLGTLLSFGHPNIPEIEKEENITHEIVRLKTGISGDNTVVVERDDSSAVERGKEDGSGVVEKSTREASLTQGDSSEADNDDRVIDRVSLSDQNSRELQFERDLIEEDTERKLYESDVECNKGSRQQKLGDGKAENHYSLVQSLDDESSVLESNKSTVDFIDSLKVDHFNAPPHSNWKHLEDGEEEDDEASDSGSDGAESSSPDASMADIIPMLDELHPLLDEEALHPAHVSHDGSDAASERSVDSNESDKDSNPQEKSEAGDDNDDDEEEEEAAEDKEHAFKSAVKWTEDDQKNLMELGISELERNQRLESLIARRRARKNLRAITEKNLIDLDGVDLPSHVAPISTARQNPFDVPGDLADLAIPGSAPSILLPRRNPFDLPYDSNEEKPDLMEDSFQQDFTTFQRKDPFFRRHESFNVGPSFFGATRQERHDISLRPYFMPERMASEGTTYPTFQRQSSDLSDSKASSIPDTESTSSAQDLEDKKLIEEDMVEEPDLITSIEHASENIGHGSHSSDDIESVELGQGEMKDAQLEELEFGQGNMENHHNAELIFHETVSNTIELTSDELGVHTEAVEKKYNSSSSSSSESEVGDKIFDVKVEELSPMAPGRNNFIEESNISTQPMVEKSSLNVSNSSETEAQQKEPVYDSSPPAAERSRSSSVPSDLHEAGFPPVLVKRTISFTEKESELINQGIENDIPVNDQMLLDSVTAVENESGQNGVTKKASDSSENEDVMYEDNSNHHEQGEVTSSSFDVHVVHLSEGKEAESVASSHQSNSSRKKILDPTHEKHHPRIIDQVSHNHLHTPSAEPVEEHLIDKEVAVRTVHDHVHSLNSDASSHIGFPEEVDEKIVSALYPHVPEEKTISQSEEELPSSLEHVNESSFENHQELKEPSSFPPSNNSNASELIKHNGMSSDIHDNLQTEALDEIKEIDGLLYELDTVGDFSVRDFVSSLDEVEKHPVTGGENFMVRAPETISAQAVEVYTTDGNNLRASRVDRVIDFAEEKMEGGSKFQTPETSSTKHVDSSDGDFVYQQVKNPIDVKSINNDSLPMKSEVRSSNGIQSSSEVESVVVKTEISVIESEKPHEVEIIAEIANGVPVVEPQEDVISASKQIDVDTEVGLRESGVTHEGEIKVESADGMPVLEARTLEDIDSAFRQIGMKSVVEVRESEVPHEGQSKVESSGGMPVLEARALEYIDSALKQSDGIAIEKPVVVDSLHTGTKSEGSNVAKSNLDLTVEGSVKRDVLPVPAKDGSHRAEPQGSIETTTESGFIEIKTKEIAHVSLQEVSGDHAETLPKLNSEDESAEADSSKIIGLDTEVSGLHKSSPDNSEKLGHEVETSKH